MKGITITPLTKIPDDRGTVLHMMRSDSKLFRKFGEIYFSTVYPNIVKAWHLHKEMTLNYCVIKGMIRLVVYEGEEFEEIYMGDNNYILVTIEPNIWNGFMGIGTGEAIVANLTDIPHDKDEIVRRPFNYFDYDWKVKNR